jgi:hypothetical protein
MSARWIMLHCSGKSKVYMAFLFSIMSVTFHEMWEQWLVSSACDEAANLKFSRRRKPRRNASESPTQTFHKSQQTERKGAEELEPKLTNSFGHMQSGRHCQL